MDKLQQLIASSGIYQLTGGQGIMLLVGLLPFVSCFLSFPY